MKRTLVFGLLFLFGYLASAFAQTADLSRAKSLYKDGKYQESLVLCDQILEKDPKNTGAYNTRGACKYRLGQYEEAIADYDSAIAYGLHDEVIYDNRANSKRALGHYASAIQDHNQAILIKPESAMLWRGRASTYYAWKHYEEAMKDVNEAIRLQPNDSYAQELRGLIFVSIGDYRNAEDAYTKAIQLNGKEGRFYAYRSTARRRGGNVKDALKDAEEAIKRGVTTGTAYTTRGFSRLENKDFNGALKDFNKALEIEPKNSTFVANLGRYYFETGKLNEAADYYEKARAIDPRNATVYRYRAELFEKRGDLDKAGMDAIMAVSLDPKTPSIRELASKLVPGAANVAKGLVGEAPQPTSFGFLDKAAGVVSKTPDKVEGDPTGDVLWSPISHVPIKPPTLPSIEIPPTLEFRTLSMDLYDWAVTTAREGMRVVIGPMTPENEAKFEAKWAPYYDAPTPEILNYLNQLNPLLAKFLAARSGFTYCSQEMGKAMFESGLLAEAGKNAEAKIAMDAGRTYKGWMDGYESAMKQAGAAIEALGPMPNPYEAQRKRAKRLNDELKKLQPEAKPQSPDQIVAGKYWVLTKIMPYIAKPQGANISLTTAEGFVACSVAGRTWYVEKGTINVQSSVRWTPFPRIFPQNVPENKYLIKLSANAQVEFKDVPEEAISGFELREKMGIGLYVTDGGIVGESRLIKSCTANAKRPSEQKDEDFYRLVREAVRSTDGKVETLTLAVAVSTLAGWTTYRYEYLLTQLTAEQADELRKKGEADISAMGKEQEKVEAVAAEGAEKVGRYQFLMDSRRMFSEDRNRLQQELAAAADPKTQKELMLRLMYADAQMHASEDALHYADTGQWQRTRTLYDDYDFNRMVEIGRQEAERIALPARALKAAEAQIAIAPEHLRETLRDQLRKGLTTAMMQGKDSEGLRKLAGSLAGQVQQYWTRQSEKESFKGTIASIGEEAVKIGAGVAICGAGTVYVAGLGASGVTLWATDTLLGASYGGVSGYVEGGPDEACRKSLEWAGSVGFIASTAINAYGSGADATGVVSSAARAVVLMKSMEYAGKFAAGFFGKPTVQEQFAMAQFHQEMEFGQALLQRSSRAEKELAEALSKGMSGEALAKLEREANEVAAAVNGSYHAKLLLKYGADEVAGKAFINRIEKIYADVQPAFVEHLQAMGYDIRNLKFEPIRNSSSAGTVSMDLDLRLIESPGLVIRKNGVPISLRRFQEDAQQAYNRVYFAKTGYSAQQSLVNITTTSHYEAFTEKMSAQKIPFWALGAYDRQRAGEVLIGKTYGFEMKGFTQSVEASRAIEKELRNRLLPDLKTQLTAATAKGDKKLAATLTDRINYWEGLRTQLETISRGESDPYKIWRGMQEIRGQTGKDVFELARALADYWPALGKFK